MFGSRQQQRASAQFVDALSRASYGSNDTRSIAISLTDLPRPVKGYFEHVLSSNPRMIRLARFKELGTLRTDMNGTRWFSFEARQIVAPLVTGFAWNADVRLAPLVHLRIYDALLKGLGSSRVAFLSAFTVARAGGNLEMNSGALHRYLAEAVWYPTALLPSANLKWTPIDDRKALATLTANGETVSLEFRFNERDEIIGIYTPARWGSFDGGFKQVAWEGHFSNYHTRDGMIVPAEGEVGWYSTGQWLPVWRGTVTDASYDFVN
jgi:hypothetical protein